MNLTVTNQFNIARLQSNSQMQLYKESKTTAGKSPPLSMLHGNEKHADYNNIATTNIVFNKRGKIQINTANTILEDNILSNIIPANGNYEKKHLPQTTAHHNLGSLKPPIMHTNQANLQHNSATPQNISGKASELELYPSNNKRTIINR